MHYSMTGTQIVQSIWFGEFTQKCDAIIKKFKERVVMQ